MQQDVPSVVLFTLLAQYPGQTRSIGVEFYANGFRDQNSRGNRHPTWDCRQIRIVRRPAAAFIIACLPVRRFPVRSE
jgi:hypothetical protein